MLARETDKPYLMPVEDIFSIEGRGTVVTGRIERGEVKVGDEIEVKVLRVDPGERKIGLSRKQIGKEDEGEEGAEEAAPAGGKARPELRGGTGSATQQLIPVPEAAEKK